MYITYSSFVTAGHGLLYSYYTSPCRLCPYSIVVMAPSAHLRSAVSPFVVATPDTTLSALSSCPGREAAFIAAQIPSDLAAHNHCSIQRPARSVGHHPRRPCRPASRTRIRQRDCARIRRPSPCRHQRRQIRANQRVGQYEAAPLPLPVLLRSRGTHVFETQWRRPGAIDSHPVDCRGDWSPT